MAQVAVNVVPHECLPSSKATRNSFLSSGRGGSGNIRRLQVLVNSERSDDPPVSWPQERRCSSIVDKRPERSELPTERRNVDQRNLMSSGRGGSGNIQPSTSDLEAHPLTASILSQHNAVQAQYERWIKKFHAESNVVRSSGRGGSGNISDVRRPRSRSQGSSTAPKRRFFTTKGRERGTKCCDTVTQAHDDKNLDKRTSYVTCSSGGSSNVEVRQSRDSRVSDAVASSINSATSGPLSSEDAVTAHPGKRQSFSIRWSKLPSPTSSVAPPGSPRSLPAVPTGSPGSSSRLYSPTSVILEDREYVSFLEL